MSRRRQHYLPAALVGQFSKAKTFPTRERPVWVSRRGSGPPYVQKAENVAALDDFYTVKDSPYVGDEPGSRPLAIDEMWSTIERSLGEILNAAEAAITTSMMRADHWARLIEFLSQVLARTPDFDRRFAERFKGTGELEEIATSRDNVNAVRIMEVQRLRPALLYGRWYFLRFPAGSLVENDRGYTGTADPSTGATGVCFPLRHDLALTVLSSTDPPNVIEMEGARFVLVGSNVHDASGARSLSEVTAAWADSEIYGASEHAVRSASAGLDGERQSAGPEVLFGHASGWLRDHELDYFVFISTFAGSS